MESKQKIEILPVILAIIGLIADVIGISSLWNSQIGTTFNDFGSKILFSKFIYLYSWITISWFIVRLDFHRRMKSERKHRLKRTILRSTTGVGIILLPIAVLIDFLSNSKLDFFYLSIFAFFPFVLISIKLLINLLYDDMDQYLSRKGLYVAKYDLTMFGKLNIPKNDVIEIMRISNGELFFIGGILEVNEFQFLYKNEKYDIKKEDLIRFFDFYQK